MARPLRPLALRGMVPTSWWRRLPAPELFRVNLPEGGSFRYAVGDGDTWARSLYWRGVLDIESETIAVFMGLARQGRTFIDVGAYAGLFSLVASAVSPTIQSRAYEASPRSLPALQKNVLINEFAERIHVRPVAVLDRCGPARFAVPLGHSMPTSAHLSSISRLGETQEFEVKGVSLDLDQVQESVDLIKIDVEGAEHLVLEGASHTLATNRPAVIVETLPGGPVAAVEDLMLRHGYVILNLRAGGPVAANHIVVDPSRRLRNTLFVSPGGIGANLI